MGEDFSCLPGGHRNFKPVNPWWNTPRRGMEYLEAEEAPSRAARFARGYLPPMVLALVATVVVIRFWNGGTLEHEALTFISNYTADQSLLKKVFDPHANDFGTYQARELSYFFDYLDANIHQSIVARYAPAFFIPT